MKESVGLIFSVLRIRLLFAYHFDNSYLRKKMRRKSGGEKSRKLDSFRSADGEPRICPISEIVAKKGLFFLVEQEILGPKRRNFSLLALVKQSLEARFLHIVVIIIIIIIVAAHHP